MENAERSAYPVPELLDQMGDQLEGVDVIGLTKREYFAAMAMQGIISGKQSNLNTYADDYIGKASVKLADELLRQLSK